MDGGWWVLQGKKVLNLTEMKGKNIFLIYYKCKHYSFTLNHETNFLCCILIFIILLHIFCVGLFFFFM